MNPSENVTSPSPAMDVIIPSASRLANACLALADIQGMGGWPSAVGRRVGGGESALAGIGDAGAGARFLGFAYIGGSALALVSMAFPQPPGTNVAGLFALYGVGFVTGGLLLWRGARLSQFEIALALISGTVLISLGILGSEQRVGVYCLFYVWIALEAFYFLSWRSAFFQVALVAVAFALVIAVERPAGYEEQWLITVGTVLASGVLVGALRTRVERLIVRLADAARTDPLTELRNRRGFGEALESEVERHRRSGHELSLLVADLDHFKRVNDRLGHPLGDRALQRFAETLLSLTRRMDSAARLGGEEFALVLPETAKHDAFLAAERLRRGVRIAFAQDPVPLTVSVGVATFPQDGATGEALLRSADQALYAAKQLGRDRSVLFNPEIVNGLMRADTERQSRSAGQLSAALVLAETIDMRDTGSAEHSQTVGRYAAMTARQLGLNKQAVERIQLAGVLHDVGKIGVSDSILRKPGPLTDDEWTEMKTHPELGARIVAGADLEDVAEWIFAHHERIDGRGYPLALTGDEIPLEARILAVADAYETMIRERPYARAMDPQLAEAELRRCADTQFDPLVVEALTTALHHQKTRLLPANPLGA